MPDDSNPTLLKKPSNLRPSPNVRLTRGTPRVDDSLDADFWKPVSNLAGSRDAQSPDLDEPFIDAGTGAPDIRFFGEGTITRDSDEDILGDVEVGLGLGDPPKDAGEARADDEIAELIDRLSCLAGDDESDIFKLLPRVESALSALGKILSRTKDKNLARGPTEPVVEPAGAQVADETAEPVVEPGEAAEEAPQEEEPEPARKVRDYERILQALRDLPGPTGIFTAHYDDEIGRVSDVNVERIKKLYGIFEDLTEEEVNLRFEGLSDKKILEAWDEIVDTTRLGAPLHFNGVKEGVKVCDSLHYTRVSDEPFEDHETADSARHINIRVQKQNRTWDVVDGDSGRHLFKVGLDAPKSSPYHFKPSNKVDPPVVGQFRTYVMDKEVRYGARKLTVGERISFNGVIILRLDSAANGGIPECIPLPGFAGAIREGWAHLEDKVEEKPIETPAPSSESSAAAEKPVEVSTGHTVEAGHVRTRLALPSDVTERRALVKFLASHDADLLTLDKSSVEVSIPR